MTLSALPNEWSLTEDPYEGRYFQCWLPGAFGEYGDIEFVVRYVVEEDEWENRDDGVYRTIKKARILEPHIIERLDVYSIGPTQ